MSLKSAYPVGEIDLQLGVDHAPFPATARPLLRDIHHCQIQHLQKAVVRWKYRLRLGNFAKLAIETLYRICRVNQCPHLLGVLEIRTELCPIIPPGGGDFAAKKQFSCNPCLGVCCVRLKEELEAAPGFEPGVKDLQSSALPLGYAAAERDTY